MKKNSSIVFLALVSIVLCVSCSQQKKQPLAVAEHSKKKYSADQLPKLTGLVVPANLPQLVQRSNKLSAQLVKTVKETAPDVGDVIDHQFCSPSDQVVDFRALNLVSPVKDQQECGACWAFATNAVIESSYLATRSERISASEQELISCYSGGSCAGGWWAFDFLMKPGIESDKSYAYEHSDSACRMPISVEFRALRSGYVAASGQENTIPTSSDLKIAICKHGPLAVAFNATPAFIQFGYDHHDQGAIFSEDDDGVVNHGIVLVGWDENRLAWIIKNSWNTTWGDEGFLYVKYGTNKIGFGAAWAEAWPKDYTPAQKVRKLFDTQMVNALKMQDRIQQ
jgi:cathepsin L